MGFDWKAHAGHGGHTARGPGHAHRDLASADRPARGLNTAHRAVFNVDASNFAVLNDIDATAIGTTGIAPGHRIVTNRATAPLIETAFDREARIVEIEKR